MEKLIKSAPRITPGALCLSDRGPTKNISLWLFGLWLVAISYQPFAISLFLSAVSCDTFGQAVARGREAALRAHIDHPTRNFATLGPFKCSPAAARSQTLKVKSLMLMVAHEIGLYLHPFRNVRRIVSEDSPYAFKMSCSEYFRLPPSFMILLKSRILITPFFVR